LLLSTKKDWFGNIRGDVLSGLVVALALIPEAIAFSIIAGVDPKVGLYASFCIAVVISFVGGRPGMISAAPRTRTRVFIGCYYFDWFYSNNTRVYRCCKIDEFCGSCGSSRVCKCSSYSYLYGSIT